jgi:hypothetical protein
VFTPEDTIDDLHEELGRARRHADSLGRDLHRVTNEPELARAERRARERVAVLERELADALAEQARAEEEFAS